MRRGAQLTLLWSILLTTSPGLAQPLMPFRSYDRLVSSNGHAVVSYDRAARRVDTFLEHPYRFRTPSNDPPDLCFAADETRDLSFDSYFGVRSGGRGQWLTDAPLDEGGYVPGTGIMRTVQHTGVDRAIEVTTWTFAPMALDQPAVIMVAEARNVGTAPTDASLYVLFNNHLGLARGGREPDAVAEETSFDPARQTLYEYGPGQGTMAYVALSPLAHASASTGAASAWSSLAAGRDLDDIRATTAPTTDVSPGFQSPTVTLAPGAVVRLEVAMVWALDEDAGPDVDALRAFLASTPPEQKEQQDWTAWHTTPPADLSAAQGDLWLQSAAFLRMGQVREPGPGFGQILASLPPGSGSLDAQWNIAWVRDMAYAVVGLVRSGHLNEARAALAFQVNAPLGRHPEVGLPYRISVTRYFGDGKEESDCNADGPNIEFDGFGLFLWSLGEYLRASGGDPASLSTWWPTLRDEVADVLVSLVEPSGVIRADSSIWEVHWNGRERRFTYTSLAAVRGLCDAADMADAVGEPIVAMGYRSTARQIRQALMGRHTDRRGALAQSAEDLLTAHHYVDAATVEAINWGIVDPGGRVAQATLDAVLDTLTVPSGMGLMRNDDGGWYDSQEWVFVDLRVIPALTAAGRAARAGAMTTWLEGQALANDLQFAELFDAGSGAFTGSIPMVGFGAGAYLVALSGVVTDPACGEYATEPAAPANDGGLVDAGCPGCPRGEDPGCGCRVQGGPARPAWIAFGFGIVALILRRRARRRAQRRRP